MSVASREASTRAPYASRWPAGRTRVLKAEPRTHPGHLDDVRRARRVVDHMRGRGYPTPAWLGVGATATHVWHLVELVDAVPSPELTPALVEQLVEVVELQAGQASEPHDHSSYAWRVATGREPVVAAVSATRRGVRPGRTPAARVRRRPTASRCARHGPRRPQPEQRAGPRRRGGRARRHRQRRQRHARDGPHHPAVAHLPGRRWTASAGCCGPGSSAWSAGRGQRYSRRPRSSCSSSGRSGSDATTSSPRWSSVVTVPSTSWTPSGSSVPTSTRRTCQTGRPVRPRPTP